MKSYILTDSKPRAVSQPGGCLNRRFLSAALLLFLFLFSGCRSPEPIDRFATDDTDLSGYECTVGQGYPETAPFRYTPDTVYSDLVFERMKELDRLLNCTSSIRNIRSDGYLESTVSSIAAGAYVAEIAATHQPSYIVYGGVLYPLTEVKDILDYEDSEKYGSKGLLEIGMMDSCPYTVCPVLWPEKLSSYSYSILAVNEELVLQNGLTDPREFHEQKLWTFDTFLSKLPEYTLDRGDGDSFRAFLSGGLVLQYAAAANGLSCRIPEEGIDADFLKTPSFYHAVEFYKALLTDYRDCVSLNASGYDDTVRQYLDGRFVLFNTSFAHLVESVIYEADNYGIVPFPSGPDVEYGKAPALISDFDSIGIFSCSVQADAAARYISLLLEPFDGYDEEGRRDTLQNLFFDDRDIEIYLHHLDRVEFDYWTSGVSSVWISMQGVVRKNSGAELAEKYGETLITVLRKQAFGNADYMNSH